MKCYSCQKDLEVGENPCRSCGQPVYTTHQGAGIAKGRRVDGGRVAPASPKDYIATSGMSALPRKVDLRQHCSPVEDQGQVGSCAACAVVGAMEYQQRKAGRPVVDLSRMFVYFNGRRMRGTEHEDSGMSVPEAMAAFMAFGAPPETDWPYDPALLTKAPDQAVYNKAREHTPGEYARVSGQENIRGALAQGFPVSCLFQVPVRCFDEAGRTGLLPPATPEELARARGETGHIVLAVGYDLDTGHYLIRNSWGESWGDRGYFRAPFDVCEAGVHPFSTWILGKLDAAPMFQITRPARAAAPADSTPIEGGVKDLAAKMRTEIRDSLTKEIADSIKGIKDRVNPPRRG